MPEHKAESRGLDRAELSPLPPARRGALHLRRGPCGWSPRAASGDEEPAPKAIWKWDIGKITSQSIVEPEVGLICVLEDGPANAEVRCFVPKEEHAAPEGRAGFRGDQSTHCPVHPQRTANQMSSAQRSRSWDTGEDATWDPPHFGTRHRSVTRHSLNHLQRFGRNAGRGLFVGQESIRRREGRTCRQVGAGVT